MRAQNSSSSASSASNTAEVTARDLFALAFPALGVLAATPLYLLLDTAVVGRLGAFELAALAAGTTLQSQLTSQLTFLSYGTTARSARLYGQGRRGDAIAEGVQATWVGFVVGVVLMAVVLACAPTFATWLTGDPVVAGEAARWMRISSVAIPLTLVVMAGNGWMRGIQEVRRPLVFTLAGVIPGAILVPILVFRHGIVGSAIANVCGVTITAACFFMQLVRWHEGGWRPRWSVISSQLVLGRDLILRSLSFQVAFLSAAGIAGRFGPAALAAHQILLQLWNFIGLILDSLAIAAQTLTGSALGRGTVARARAVGVATTKYSAFFALGLAVVFALGAGVIPGIFTPDDAVLAEVGGPWWLMVGMIVMAGVVFALDGVLLGAADAGFLRNVSLAAVLCGFLPGAWIAYFTDGGLIGVWWGLVAFIAIRLVAVTWRFRSLGWAASGRVGGGGASG